MCAFALACAECVYTGVGEMCMHWGMADLLLGKEGVQASGQCACSCNVMHAYECLAACSVYATVQVYGCAKITLGMQIHSPPPHNVFVCVCVRARACVWHSSENASVVGLAETEWLAFSTAGSLVRTISASLNCAV